MASRLDAEFEQWWTTFVKDECPVSVRYWTEAEKFCAKKAWHAAIMYVVDTFEGE
jgi:hypothetical protein